MIATIDDAIRALEDLSTTPRDLPCPGCPSATAMERLTMHRHVPGRIEATRTGAVRWWRCSDCGMERALDSVAIPLPARIGEVLPC